MGDQDELAALRARVEALERMVAKLAGRIDDLEAGAGTVDDVDFHIPDEEPTV